jgi:hypothetical protein
VKASQLTAAAAVIALGIRLARSRNRRVLHPDGRSFTGELRVWGSGPAIGADLVDCPGRHPVTVRLSKGIGTRPGRPDIMGVAIRVHGAGRDDDLLLSSAGTGRVTRHLPAPRRTFETWYGSITSYRSLDRHKVYLAACADPAGVPLGRSLESVAAAARSGQGRLLLYALRDGSTIPFGRVTFGAALPSAADAALAFDAIRNSSADLHPSGTVHGLRALAYPLSQRWRRVSPPSGNRRAVARTAAGL